MENVSTDSNFSNPTPKRGLKGVPAWLRNKYFLSLAAFIAILFFFDKNDLFTQIARVRELKDLQAAKRYYTGQIATERKELEQLKNSPATLEKYAREKYLMKRDNEDLFIVSEKPDNPKN